MKTTGTTMAGWTAAVGGILAVTVAALFGAAVLTARDAGATTTPTTVTTARNTTWGKILVLGNGTTVYRLTTDPKDKSVCKGECAMVWPPVLLAADQRAPVARGGVTGLGTITRSGGARQVTYQGVPLYRFTGDHKTGQATGNIKDTWGRWWVVNPADPRVAPAAAHPTTAGSPTTTAAGSGVAY